MRASLKSIKASGTIAAWFPLRPVRKGPRRRRAIINTLDWPPLPAPLIPRALEDWR